MQLAVQQSPDTCPRFVSVCRLRWPPRHRRNGLFEGDANEWAAAQHIVTVYAADGSMLSAEYDYDGDGSVDSRVTLTYDTVQCS